MKIQKRLKLANIMERNTHRFMCRIHGKFKIISSHQKDFNHNVASPFGHFNNQVLMSATTALILLGLSSAFAANLPTGFSEIAGSVSAPVISNNGHTMTVHTNTINSGAGWTTFDIGSGYNVNLIQPNSHSSMLNHVTGGQPSDIFGTLTSNGSIYLINPSGIVFGSGAQVNVGSLFASTLDISPSSFINSLGGVNGTGPKSDLVFSRTGDPNAVTNAGNITAAKGGFVILTGGAVQNTGTINVSNGNATLAVGDQVTLSPDPLVGVHIRVDENLKQAVAGYTEAVKNLGTINAPGSLVQLQANLDNAVYASAVNNSGVILANAVSSHDGIVELVALGPGSNANVVNADTGLINASGKSDSIDILASNDVTLAGTLKAGSNFNILADHNITTAGNLTAGTNFNIIAGNNITNTGTLTSGKAFSIDLNGDFNNGDKGVVTAGTDLSIKAGGNIFNNDSLIAGKNINLNSLSFSTGLLSTGFANPASNIIAKGGDLTITTNGGALENFSHQIISSGNIFLSTPGSLDSYGPIQATKNLTVSGGGILNTNNGNTSIGELISLNGNVKVTSCSQITNNQLIFANKGNIDIQSDTFSQNGGKIIAGGKLTIQTDHDLTNSSGILQSVGNLTLNAGINSPPNVVLGNIENDGTVTSTKGKIDITATQDITNTSSIQGHGDVRLSAGTPTSSGVIFNSGTLKSDTGSVIEITHP